MNDDDFSKVFRVHEDDDVYVDYLDKTSTEKYLMDPHKFFSSTVSSQLGMMDSIITRVRFVTSHPVRGKVAKIVAFKNTGIVELYIVPTPSSLHLSEWKAFAPSTRIVSGRKKHVTHWSVLKDRTTGFLHSEIGEVPRNNALLNHILGGLALDPVSMMKVLDRLKIPVYEAPEVMADPLVAFSRDPIEITQIRVFPGDIAKMRLTIQHPSKNVGDNETIPVCILATVIPTILSKEIDFSGDDIIVKMWASKPKP